MENTMENTVESTSETVAVSRKRQRKPSVKVSEAAASSGTARTRGRKAAKVDSSTDNGSLRSTASKRAVVKKGTGATSRRSAVTTTKLIGEIWGQYNSSYQSTSPRKTQNNGKQKKGSKGGEEKWTPYYQSPKKVAGRSKQEVRWVAEATRVTSDGNAVYGGVSVDGALVSAGCVVLVRQHRQGRDSCACLVEYMFETSDKTKVVHGRVMVGAFETVLGSNADRKELCLTNHCIQFDPSDVIQPLAVKIQRNEEEEEGSAEPTKFFCRNLYCPDKGGFFSLRTQSIGADDGECHSCNTRKADQEKNRFSFCPSTKSFTYRGVEYKPHDFLYVSPQHFTAGNQTSNQTVSPGEDETVSQDEDETGNKGNKGKEDSRPKAYAICQLLEADASSSSSAHPSPESVTLTVKRFYRPEDVNIMDAYLSDIHAVYCSEKVETIPVTVVQGKCEVRKREDFEFKDFPYINEDTFFCEYILNDPDKRQKLDPITLATLTTTTENEADKDSGNGKVARKPLATLDMFSGCGGLSEGLEKSGASLTKWAIEFDPMAAEAFKLNHPDAFTVVHDCNVVLRDIMEANGDADNCIPSSDATISGSKLDDEALKGLPQPGEVDFIIAGPPCQGFSVLNRYKRNSGSDDNRTMILSLLSYVDYFRPKYMLMENVRNLVCFDNMQPFQLTLKSLLEMGYQVRFGVLEAGFYGVAQSRRRVFIWAASPEETIPEWPQPMHAFPTPQLRIKLDLEGKFHYSAVRSTKAGAPLRGLTVRDIIGDLPALTNGDTLATMQYKNDPVSWFQKRIRGNMKVLSDHAAKTLNELNLIHCQYLSAGQDWRDLPEKKVLLSNGKYADLKPQWLLRFLKRGTQSKGVLGRLDWEKSFPTAITNPQPRGKVGRWFHPVQHRMISVREYARSQGFPDCYKFVGTLKNKYQQVGNAVPPPLAFALGRKLREAREVDQ